jgi:hypothetical protein
MNLKDTNQAILISSAIVVEAEVIRWLLTSEIAPTLSWTSAVAVAVAVPCALLATHKED